MQNLLSSEVCASNIDGWVSEKALQKFLSILAFLGQVLQRTDIIEVVDGRKHETKAKLQWCILVY